MWPLLCLLAAPCGDNAREPVVSIVALDDDGDKLALREVDGDGRLDLIQIEQAGFGFRFMLEDGSYSPAFDAYLPWPGDHLAWDIVDLDGDGTHEVVTLASTGEVRSWRPGLAGGPGEGELVLASRSYLPHGVSRMRFVRDIDENGRADLVLPAAGQFRIHLQGEDGSWAEVIEIEYEAEIDYRVGDPESLESEFGQSLRIPWFSMDDVDGDGTNDLISLSADRADFHLARPELSATPTWSLELTSAAAEESGSNGGFDIDDLFSNLDQGVKWRIEELDGEAPRDLVVQDGSTIKTYLGGSVRGASGRPDQVLKISGNLLHYFLRDIEGDPHPELQLLRVEQVGLGQALRWLVLPGSLDFELFTYRNEQGRFSRKPTRRNQVALKIPRLVSLVDDLEELEEEIERQRRIPARRMDLDGDGERDDVVDIRAGRVLFFLGCAAPADSRFESLQSGSVDAMLDSFLLEDLDRLESGETRTIDLGGYAEWNYSPASILRESTQGVEPWLETKALGKDVDFEVRTRDLDSDGRDDVITWTQLDSGEYLVQFLVLPGS